MKKTILGRYEVNENNQVIIDVFIKSIDILYHDFDKTAPYHRKELDQDFADYILESVQELGHSDFIIQLSFEHMPSDRLKKRICQSIENYFIYLKEIQSRLMKSIFRRSILLFIVGFILLVLAIIANRKLPMDQGVIAEVFARGLTIAAWVSLWEAIVNVYLDWLPHKENIGTCNKILNAEIVFRSLQVK